MRLCRLIILSTPSPVAAARVIIPLHQYRYDILRGKRQRLHRTIQQLKCIKPIPEVRPKVATELNDANDEEDDQRREKHPLLRVSEQTPLLSFELRTTRFLSTSMEVKMWHWIFHRVLLYHQKVSPVLEVLGGHLVFLPNTWSAGTKETLLYYLLRKLGMTWPL